MTDRLPLPIPADQHGQLSLRPAQPEDYAFCRRLYFDNMEWIIQRLNLDVARQREGFSQRWQVAEVRIITVAGEGVGWLQTAPADDAIFLGQLYLDSRFQRQWIGSRVMRILFEEAMLAKKAVTLGVAKINPARRLYERLGCCVTHDDEHKLYMRR